MTDTDDYPSAQLFPEAFAHVPAGLEDVFEDATSRGRSPSGIVAAMQYLTTDKQRQEVAAEFDVTELTVGNATNLLIDEYGLEDTRPGQGNPTIPREVLLEDVRRVADIVGTYPTTWDYQKHGNHAYQTLYAKFDADWMGVVRIALDDAEVPADD